MNLAGWGSGGAVTFCDINHPSPVDKSLARITGWPGTVAGGSLSFQTRPQDHGPLVSRMSIDADGVVFIGSMTIPASDLNNFGGITVTGHVVITPGLDVWGYLAASGLPSADPGPNSKQFWYDAADGNRVKYSP